MYSKAAWTLALSLIFLMNYSYSQQDFSVDLIPDSLTSHANSVVRSSHINIDILKNKMIYSYDYAITALNKKHEDKLVFYENFQKKEIKISNIDIAIYDAEGNMIKKVKKKDIKEYGIQDIEFAKDTRTAYYSYSTQKFPKTMHVIYQLEVESPYYLRTWLPVSDYKQAVEQSSITIVDHVGDSYVYKAFGLSDGNVDGANSITFNYNQKVPLYKEKYMPHIGEVFPRLELALKRLKYYDHNGYVNGWKDFGSWVYQEMYLPKQDLKLPSLKEETSYLISDSDTKKQIAKKLYKYIQENTRYILILLADGGWSPLPTSVVHSRKYGDCKALSFYYITLCSAYGIDATLALVNAGEEKQSANEDFYSTIQFNHVISKLNIEGNSYWVDCTSKKMPFNFLGDFTDDRKVLLLNNEEGLIDKTPEYKCVQTTITDMTLSEEAGLKASMDIVLEGIGITDKLYTQTFKSEQEKASYQQSLLSKFINPKIEAYQFSFDTTNLKINEHVEFSCQNEGEKFGKHLKIKLDRGGIAIPKLKKDKHRDWPIQFLRNKEYHVKTTLNHDLSLVPVKDKDIEIESEFGSYQFKTSSEAGKITINRVLKINKSTYSPNRYKEIKSFFDKIKKIEKRSIMLSNKS